MDDDPTPGPGDRFGDRFGGLARVRIDPAQVKVLAHPMRSRLLAALRTDGPGTSAALAARLGTNTGQTSYHLRQLAEVGLIHERTEEGTGRERVWAATHAISSFEPGDFADDPDAAAAVEWLEDQNQRFKAGWVADWLRRRGSAPAAWQRAATSTDLRLRLTPAQLEAMEGELMAVIERYLEAGPDDEADAEPVMVLLDAFPAPELVL